MLLELQTAFHSQHRIRDVFTSFKRFLFLGEGGIFCCLLADVRKRDLPIRGDDVLTLRRKNLFARLCATRQAGFCVDFWATYEFAHGRYVCNVTVPRQGQLADFHTKSLFSSDVIFFSIDDTIRFSTSIHLQQETLFHTILNAEY